MKGEKIREEVCPACNGTGYPTVKQPSKPSVRIYPKKCQFCGGKGKLAY